MQVNRIAFSFAIMMLPIFSVLHAETPGGRVDKTYYDNGGVKGEVFYRENGKIAGLKEYYENGTLKEEAVYLNDTDSKIKTYDETGILIAEGVSKNGAPEGVWKEYNKEGRLTKEIIYKDQKLAIRKVYRKNGSLKYEQEGPVTRMYDQNGRLYKQYTRTPGPDNTTQLRTETFDPNAEAWVWSRTEKVASTQLVYAEGRKTKKLFFDANEKVVKVKQFDDEGNVIYLKSLTEAQAEEAPFKSGAQNGVFKKFNAAGEIQELNYRGGQVLEQKTYHHNGAVKEVLNFSNGQVTATKRFDENGTPVA